MPSPSSSAHSRRISAAASTEAKGRVVADSPWTDNVRPISPAMPHRIVDIRPTRHVVIEPSLEPLSGAVLLVAVIGFGVLIGGVLATVLP